MATFQNPRTGQFADIDDVELAASAARTATGQGAAVALGDRGTLRLLLDVTAASGTGPTLDVTVETSFDGATGWRSLGTFAQKTAVASERKSFPGCDRYVRATWTVGGTTPSFTFSVAGEAV
jgi:hypothetical protein